MKNDCKIICNEYGNDWDIYLHVNDNKQGHAYCTLGANNRLRIIDININQEIKPNLNWVQYLLLKVGLVKKSMLLRNKGLGTHLMKYILSKAEQIGVVEIWGSVVQGDINATPYLLKWYKKFGFKVLPADGEAKYPIYNAVYKVVLNLKAKQ